jgi:hypothetical protein
MEIQLMAILLRLPVADLGALASTNKEMNGLCIKDELWEALFKRGEHQGIQFEGDEQREPGFWKIQYETYYGRQGFMYILVLYPSPLLSSLLSYFLSSHLSSLISSPLSSLLSSILYPLPSLSSSFLYLLPTATCLQN